MKNINEVIKSKIAHFANLVFNTKV